MKHLDNDKITTVAIAVAVIFFIMMAFAVFFSGNAEAHHGKDISFDQKEEHRTCSYRWGCKNHQ